jgi:hypothetical protein
VDIADPAHPHTVGAIPGRPVTTTRELRAVADRKLLVVLSYSLGRGGVNRLDLYRWQGDCAQPTAAGSYDFGGRAPHELYLWQQPGGDRLLLFTTMFSGGAADLQVVDASDPATPHLAGSWSPPIGLLHSVALSDDGRRAFLSLWTGGLLVADASQFTTGQSNPQLSLLTPPAAVLRPLAGGNVHSAVPLPGRDLVIVTDERYPPACHGPARLVDVSNPAQPRAVSMLTVPEEGSANCAGPVATYTSHNPTLVGDLAFVSWYSSGLQVFDLASLSQPVRLAQFRPQGVEAGARDPQLGATATLTWSYPIVRDGLIYVADINQGLYVVRYQGPHQEQLERVAFAEGNSNLSRLRPAPTPTPSATPAAVPTASSPRAAPSSSPAASRLGSSAGVPIIAGAVGLLILAAVAYLILVRPRAPRR